MAEESKGQGGDNEFIHIQNLLAGSLLGAHHPTPWVNPEMSLISFNYQTLLSHE